MTKGQKVTVAPIKTWWTGGGSRKGEYCDWRGYPRKTRTRPWMTLVAAGGDASFAPENNALTFTAPADGKLVLYANDDRPEGNEGSALVTVIVAAK